MKKNQIEEFKKNHKANYDYIARVRMYGIIGIVCSVGMFLFDYINRNDRTLIFNYKFSIYLDISFFVVSVIFLVMSGVMLNKLVKKYNLKKYNDNKKKKATNKE